ncbi:molybdopterin-binding protein [Phenylobacterium montanum]|uniref:Molybdopterin-binding protein n=1 Tax=Phenylobacterium montanum TaxID=2823693 RepID=A0A975FY28_9CAUL|nr:molybdopterin-binding protein [Caulobacter sp. S6]QUD87583.1 molybdopterin-binding protein [Caulobacter sp. S6]
MALQVSRRGLVTTGSLALSGLMLSGCDRLANAPNLLGLVRRAQGVTMGSQRLVLDHQPLAREFKASEISPTFKANGTLHPGGEDYAAMLAGDFADWRLSIGGLVARPFKLGLADLRALPARTQITRHDCVEGWSAIAGWTGPQLGGLLQRAGLLPSARYIVFHCADDLIGSSDGSGLYYESIDLIDAFHPQTILAHSMNGSPLQVPHGAPLRLRVERQLGYKQAKYVMAIEAVDRLDKIGGGKGGFWEDRGYEWYAGI